jgi:hypothetical protein
VPRRKPAETDQERLRVQTGRNLEGLERERAGDTAAAVALYEQNVAERFQGEWPYIRLATIYERLGRREDVLRVIQAATEAFARPGPRPAADRRAVLKVFRQRLREIARAERQQPGGAPEGAGG